MTKAVRSQRRRESVNYLENKLEDGIIDESPGSEFNFVEDVNSKIGLCTTIKVTTCTAPDSTVRWPRRKTKRPYNLARPTSDEDLSDIRLRQQPPTTPSLTIRRFPHHADKEGFSYAKALVQDDGELERFARKMRSQIRRTEMLELASQAEKAADAGVEKFSGRPSTFWDGKGPPPTPPTQTPSLTVQSIDSSDDEVDAGAAISPTGQRRRLVDSPGASLLPKQVLGFVDNAVPTHKAITLRDVTEVIPPWQELHSHMRTHFYRREVDEDTLRFREGDQEPTPPRTRSLHNSSNSNNFFKDFSMRWSKNSSRLRSKTGGSASGAVSESGLDTPETGEFGKIGDTVASHLSPTNSSSYRSQKRSLRLSEAQRKVWASSSVSPSRKRQSIMSDPGEWTSKKIFSRKQLLNLATGQGGEMANVTTGSSDSSSRLHDRANPHPLHTQVVASPENPSVALFDSFDDDASSCPPSPDPHSRQHLTPTGQYTMPNGKPTTDFETPARLRTIRGSKKKPRGNTTPDTTKTSNFEPSSIVANDEEDLPMQLFHPLHADDASFLAIPSISSPTHKSGEGRLKRRQLRLHTLLPKNISSTGNEDVEEDAPLPSLSHSSDGIQSTSSNYSGITDLREKYTDEHRQDDVDAFYVSNSHVGCDEPVEEKKSCDGLYSADFPYTAIHRRSVSFDGDSGLRSGEMPMASQLSTNPPNPSLLMSESSGTHVPVDCSCGIEETSTSMEEGSSLVYSASSKGDSKRHSVLSWPKTSYVLKRPADVTSLQVSRSHERSASSPVMLCSSEDHFHAAVRGVMSSFSPKRALRNKYFKSNENNEFLKNFFYIAKAKDKCGPATSPQEHAKLGPTCNDQFNPNDAMCTNLGVETVCNGLSEWFSVHANQCSRSTVATQEESTEPPVQQISRGETIRKRSASLQGLYEMVSSRNLGLPKRLPRPFGMSRGMSETGLDDRKSSVQFQAPALKKVNSSPGFQKFDELELERRPSLSEFDRRYSTDIRAFPRRVSTELSRSGVEAREAVLEMQSSAFATLSDQDFFSLFGVSRQNFLLLPKEERWGLIKSKTGIDHSNVL